jgi:hypothetical protein
VDSDDQVARAVRAFFVREGWTIAEVDDGPIVVRTAVEGATGRWPLLVAVTQDRRIVVFSTLPSELPDERRAVMDELISRINSGLILGNFEIDPDERSVRFKTSVGVSGVEITDELLRELVYPNVSTMESYLPALTKLASGDLSVDEAVRLAED